MTRMTGIVRVLAMALVAVVISGVLVPLCTMPECDDTGAVACTDFKPACDDCPDSVVMKHGHDDAIAVNVVTIPDLVAVPATAPTASATPVRLASTAPVPTASPPPLDPLGVRLLV